jgi:hypothetical protein
LLHSAAAFHRAVRKNSGSLLSWSGWYLGLFLVSGLGFVLASLLLFEGPSIVRESIAGTVTTLTRLQVAANTLLPVQSYNDAVSRLQQNK